MSIRTLALCAGFSALAACSGSSGPPASAPPPPSDVHDRRVRTLLWDGRDEEALAECEAMLRRDPRSGRAQEWRSLALEGLGRSELAREAWLAAREHGYERDRPALWDLESYLDPLARATTDAIVGGLAFDPYAEETLFDDLAFEWVESIERGSPELQERLRALAHGGGRARQAAASRALVHLAQSALAEGSLEVAAETGLNVYLSSAPQRVRLAALRVYASSADPRESKRWLDLIRSLRQDAAFLLALPELDTARATRGQLEGSSERRP